ncbi:MAG TPA: hypothetical protein RMH26_21395, partial [Polyangiaceae bacterium LLY-WYZ-15_(1-7)]|nr:hypothetical protein [Polyangiaceae bacterium LLY-WYZ-15_(1-7)]
RRRLPLAEGQAAEREAMRDRAAPAVGKLTERGKRRFEAKRRSEARKVAERGVALERLGEQLPETEGG